MDGAAHNAPGRRPQRTPLPCQQLRRQAVSPLPYCHAGGRPLFHPAAPVGGQTVFPAAVKHRTDTAGKPDARQGNDGSGEHHAAGTGSLPDALGPEVLAGKGAAPVRLNVPRPPGKIQRFSVQRQAPLQGMAHADDAVSALHAGEEPERAHDVRSQGCKGPKAYRAAEGDPLPRDMEAQPLVSEQAFPYPNAEHPLKSAELRIRQPPGLPVRKDLERGAPPS